MATYIQTKIFNALATKLAALTFSPALPIAWPNVNFTPPDANTGYIRAQLFPATAEQTTLGTDGQNRHTGIFQVDVIWPENQGLTAPTEKAGAIADHFKRGTLLTTDSIALRIDQPPLVRGIIVDGGTIQIPIDVRYTVDASN